MTFQVSFGVEAGNSADYITGALEHDARDEMEHVPGGSTQYCDSMAAGPSQSPYNAASYNLREDTRFTISRTSSMGSMGSLGDSFGSASDSMAASSVLEQRPSSERGRPPNLTKSFVWFVFSAQRARVMSIYDAGSLQSRFGASQSESAKVLRRVLSTLTPNLLCKPDIGIADNEAEAAHIYGMLCKAGIVRSLSNATAEVVRRARAEAELSQLFAGYGLSPLRMKKLEWTLRLLQELTQCATRGQFEAVHNDNKMPEFMWSQLKFDEGYDRARALANWDEEDTFEPGQYDSEDGGPSLFKSAIRGLGGFIVAPFTKSYKRRRISEYFLGWQNYWISENQWADTLLEPDELARNNAAYADYLADCKEKEKRAAAEFDARFSERATGTFTGRSPYQRHTLSRHHRDIEYARRQYIAHYEGANDEDVQEDGADALR
jgi:hypothetical protein